MLALMTCGAELGCARTNPFLRDEPPMLGTVTPPTASYGQGDGTAGAKVRHGQRPDGAVFPRERPLRAELQPDPTQAGAPATRQRNSRSPGETPLPQTASAPESGVRTTALDTSSDPSNPQGVVLKPPVSLNATRSSAPAPHPAASDPGPAAPQDPPATTPAGTSSATPATVEAIVASAGSDSTHSTRTRWL